MEPASPTRPKNARFEEVWRRYDGGANRAQLACTARHLASAATTYIGSVHVLGDVGWKPPLLSGFDGEAETLLSGFDGEAETLLSGFDGEAETKQRHQRLPEGLGRGSSADPNPSACQPSPHQPRPPPAPPGQPFGFHASPACPTLNFQES